MRSSDGTDCTRKALTLKESNRVAVVAVDDESGERCTNDLRSNVASYFAAWEASIEPER